MQLLKHHKSTARTKFLKFVWETNNGKKKMIRSIFKTSASKKRSRTDCSFIGILTFLLILDRLQIRH